MDHNYNIASGMLEVAVPLYIIRFNAEDYEVFNSCYQMRIDKCGEELHKYSEWFSKPGKNHETAKAFNATAEAIALLSYCPGGIEIFGHRWATQHPKEPWGSKHRKPNWPKSFRNLLNPQR